MLHDPGAEHRLMLCRAYCHPPYSVEAGGGRATAPVCLYTSLQHGNSALVLTGAHNPFSVQARLPRVRSLTEKQKMIKRLSALSFKAPVITQQKQPGWQELHKKCVLALAHSDEECAPPSELRDRALPGKAPRGPRACAHLSAIP